MTPRATGRPRRYCSDRCRSKACRSRRRRRVYFSSRSHTWETPPELFLRLAEEFGGFDLDPCATPETAKCPRFFTPANDGLNQEWTGRVFMNPPYGRAIGTWMRKAIESVESGSAELVVCLVPVRTGTRWWQNYATKAKADDVRFLPGRIRFVGATSAAPFDSALVVFRDAKSVTKLAA
jgi:phage N-6-adenine-methyltransferase